MKHLTEKQKVLSRIPSVDELLKSPEGARWLSAFPRQIVIQAIRAALEAERVKLLAGQTADIASDALLDGIDAGIKKLSSCSLLPLINATGIVLHTNLGRAVLSEKALKNVVKVGTGYSNLEYDLETGKRGKRHVHTKRLLRQITGAEDALIVNNNAAAVLLCLNTMAKDREVVVSRSELVEIGGSFRVPDVMTASNAVLREVGTTNKTHLHDYANALNENTALILKVHQSNYQIIGFTADVAIDELVLLGRKQKIPVMYDLGSGCLVDLKPYGIHTEPTVQEIVKAGVDLVSFSGDKLLGGPQGGIIVGKKKYIERIQKNPIARALRVDKLTIAAFEATLLAYMDIECAKDTIPVLQMLLQSAEKIKQRARKIAAMLRKAAGIADIRVVQDMSKAGGGSLPDAEFQTFAVQIRPGGISVNELEGRLRKGSPPVIARIRGDALLLDARTVREQEIKDLVRIVAAALQIE
ncbi:MAG: L-seryl-tRNA(Sec) selenium transferase [Nitrospiraceae bacterium]|nr:MAG: L-seryl-tRNA(Sec) selenium transferase [Nitrospiraceae bacterium]